MIDAQKTYQKSVHKIQQVIPKKKKNLPESKWKYAEGSLILEQDHENNLREHSTLGRTSICPEWNYDYVAHATKAYKNEWAVVARRESCSYIFVKNICNQW